MNAFDGNEFKVEKCEFSLLSSIDCILYFGTTLLYPLLFLADVKESVRECVGGAELHRRKQQIQTFSDQTSSALKKHVYANYMQFIETAKEISRKYSCTF